MIVCSTLMYGGKKICKMPKDPTKCFGQRGKSVCVLRRSSWMMSAIGEVREGKGSILYNISLQIKTSQPKVGK